MGIIIETTLLAYLVLSCLVGGGIAFMTGRGLALTWQPAISLVLAMLAMGAALRFLHFALFDGTLLSLHYYLSDTALLILASALGYRLTRARQMINQYRQLYRPAGPLGWSKR